MRRVIVTGAVVMTALAVGAVLLTWHVLAVPDTADSPHRVAGDLVLFGTAAVLFAGIAAYIILDSRRNGAQR